MKGYIELINKWLLKSMIRRITERKIKMTLIDIQTLLSCNLSKSGCLALTGSLSDVQFARYVFLIIE